MKRSTTPPEVDSVAAAQAAVAARRARAAVKAAVAARERRALEVAEAAWSGPAAAPEATLRVRELLMSVPTSDPPEPIASWNNSASPHRNASAVSVPATGEAARIPAAARGRYRTPSRLVVLAGPTAVGKGTVSRSHPREPPERAAVGQRDHPPAASSARSTASHLLLRRRRQFDDMIERHEFLEYATVHNAYRYGTPRPPIDAALARGRSVLLEIDLQGARQVRAAMPARPDSSSCCRRPGRNWCADSSGAAPRMRSEQARRLATARVELRAQDEFDCRSSTTKSPLRPKRS